MEGCTYLKKKHQCRFQALVVLGLVCLFVAEVSGHPSLLAPRNFINYDEDPLFALLRDRLDENPEDADLFEPSDVFMDKSRFQVSHDAQWPLEPLNIHPLGQIAGVDTDLKGNPVIFHRAERSWSSNSSPPKIKGNTIAVLDKDTGKTLSTWGNDTFYVPHGLTIDHKGNVWVTDTGSHQVFKFPPGATTPSMVLGEKFVSGSDSNHFCRPTDVAVATNGAFFISDGYCNKRIVKFDADGKFVREYKYGMNIVHDLTLIEERDAICAADRENGKVVCFPAGLRHNLQQKQQDQNRDNPDQQNQQPLVIDYSKPIQVFPLDEQLGSVFAISNLGPTIFAVRQPRSTNPQPANGVILSFDKGNIIDTWQREPTNARDANRLIDPHDVVVGKDGKTLYVAEIGPNRLSKFNINH